MNGVSAQVGPSLAGARSVPPNIFAMVMATGIVSLAAHGAGLRGVADVLFWLNVVLFAGLWTLSLARSVVYQERVADDFRNHHRAPGFFTAVAASGVMGSQCVVLYGAYGAATGLWAFALLLWFVFTYTMFPGLMEVENKPTLAEGINGGWLLAVVATQALSVLGGLLAGEMGEGAGPVLFAALAFWLLGGMLYVWLIALIFYRCLFLPLAARELTPPYWINMGAMAISTLAGVTLIQQSARLPILTEIQPFLKGGALLFWATATWWIPMLLALGVWRHLRQRVPVVYDHSYWAAVFPLGMYTVCTQQMSREFRLGFLAPIHEVFVWVALAAWGAAFGGLVWGLLRGQGGKERSARKGTARRSPQPPGT